MDKIFGESNFQNEIIWEYDQGIKSSSRKFLSNHDTILFYAKSKHYTFVVQAIPYTKKQLARFRHSDIKGKFYNDTRRDKNNQKKQVKVYLTKDGTPVGSVWHYPRTQGSERIGYPTQKPEALLKRIIEVSSNKGDIILDPFCGCGTTIAVAQQLGRQWIGIDVSPTACRMMGERLNKLGVIATLVGMPTTIDELKAMKPFVFQEWVLHKMQGTPSVKKSGDMGIDGWTLMIREPVQVKQSENVGRNVVDNFETAMRRENKVSGYIVAFSFTKSAYEECARARTNDKIDIKLVQVDEMDKYITVPAWAYSVSQL